MGDSVSEGSDFGSGFGIFSARRSLSGMINASGQTIRTLATRIATCGGSGGQSVGKAIPVIHWSSSVACPTNDPPATLINPYFDNGPMPGGFGGVLLDFTFFTSSKVDHHRTP